MRTLALAVAASLLMTSLPARADGALAADRPVAAQLSPAAAPAPALVLQPDARPLTRRPAFWIGVGAVVATVVATSVAVAVVSRGSAPTALTPDQVCAGPCNAILNMR